MPDLAHRRALLRALAALPVAAPLLAAAPANAARIDRAPIEGVALEAVDGDTFTLQADDGRRLRVRLAGIDAPESRQPFADVSRRHLREQLRTRRVRIEPIKLDPYDRVVARVLALEAPAPGRSADPGAAHDVGLAMIDAGLAWHFVRYRADQSREEFERYADAQRAARARGAGIWRDPAPEPPWDFRARTRRPPAAPAPPTPPAPAG
jgi:endonuclease YncB( thermonuclease family)